MPQPDRWPASAPDPRAPKSSAPQRDWSQAPWSDVAVQGATHVIPSYAGDLWNSAVGLAKHVTAPATPGTAGSANEPVSMGLIRGLSDRFLGTNTQQGRTTGADFARGAGEYLGSRYGSVAALKRTLATDPGGVLMDAQAAASIPEGGEGILGRVPGLVGDVARPVGAAARTFNRFTNPVTMAGSAVRATSAAGHLALKGGQVLDKTGAFTPAVHEAVQQAFPHGEVTAADLANPAFKAQLTKTLQAKGITPAAVKEATLAYHGAPAPASVVTRSRIPDSVAPTVDAARTQAQGAVAGRMQSIVGGPPDPAVLGASVEQAHDASLAAAGQNYTDLRNVPGSFGPTLNGPDLNAHIGARLASKDMPSTPALLQRSAGSYPEANAALDLVNDALVKGNTRLGGEINTPEIAEVRRQLSGNLNRAKGADQTAVGAIIDGLHDHLESTSAQGNFVGPNGPVDISGQLRAANAAYKQHFDTFGNSQGPARVIKNAVASIKGSADAGVTGADAQAAGARTIASNLANPTQGPATYAVVKNALGPQGQSVLDDYMRKAAVMAPDGSVLPTDKLRANLSGPSAGLFTPGEQSDLRIGAAAQDVLDAKAPPGARTTPNPGSMARRLTAGAVAAGAATLAAPLLPHFPFAEPALATMGALAGGVSEGLLEPHFQGEAIKRQLAGAPEPGQFLNRPEDIGRWTEAAVPAIPLAHAAGEMQPNPPLNFTFPAVPAPEVDLSAAPGPYDAPSAPTPEPPRNESKDRWPSSAPPPDMANAPAPASAPADTEDLSSEPGPYDQPVARASGGKVDGDIERLVTRLQNLAKHAKAQSKKQTEPLLRVPDATITKALDVAQRAI